MGDTAPGRANRSDESQCYNCGASGHWAIACPEPTRETPAGLVAWRKTSSAGQGNNRDQHGGSKKPRGPIITKYGPPPSLSPPVPHYPQPPAYPQPPPPYPGQNPSYPPQYPPYHSTNHHQPSPYPQPGYAPQAYYPPPHSHGKPPHVPPGPPGYAGLPQPPPGIGAAPPPGYHSFPPPPPPAHGYGPQSLYPPPQTQSFPPGYSHPLPPPIHSYPNVSKPYVPPPVLSTYITPSLPQPTRVPHSLPPKPPRPPRGHGDHQDSQRDRKRKQDRPNRHRDRDSRRKEHSSDRQPPNRKPHNQRPARRRDPSPNTVLYGNQKTPEVSEERPSEPELARSSSRSPKSVEDLRVDREHSDNVQEKQEDVSPFLPESDEYDWEWEEAAIFTEPDMSYLPDEVGTPLLGKHNEAILMPRKWDAACVDSEFVKIDNVETFVNHIRETKDWSRIQLDPAFVRDGRFPNGDPLPNLSQRNPKPSSDRNDSQDKEGRNRKHRYSNDQADDGGRTKRPKPNATSHSPRRRLEEGDSTKRRRNSHQSLGESNHSHQELREHGQTSDVKPSSPGRADTTDQRGPSSGSRMERRSSFSSDSSDLSALEAELLGRPTKKKNLMERDRRRGESNRVQRVRRRRPETDSAYSRRW